MSFTDQIKEYRDRLDAVTSAVKWVEHQSQQAPGTMSSQDKLQAALLILEAFYPPQPIWFPSSTPWSQCSTWRGFSRNREVFADPGK